MKKGIIRLSLVLATVFVLFAGCGKDEFDEDMLVGTWKCSDGFSYRFEEYGSGRCFDSDDKGMDFTWELYSDELTIEYKKSGTLGKPSREVFILEKLTSSRMEAHLVGDDYTYTFTR